MKRLFPAALVASISVSIFVSIFGLWPGHLPRASAQVLAPDEARRPLRAVLVGMTTQGTAAVLPLVDEQVNVDIDAQHATTRLRQTFHNRSGVNVEGTYTLRAGAGTRAEGFAYWNGEEKIVGEVFERATARRVYENITRQRRDPGLLEEVDEGVFSFRVSPISQDERKRVEVAYSQWLSRQAASVEYRAPVNRPDTEIAVTITESRELRRISSPTHTIDVQRLGSGRLLIRARRALGQTPATFVLRYEVADKPWTIARYLHRDKGQDGYFALTLATPEMSRNAAVPKDVTLVIDRSGSMVGETIRQARAACLDIVRRLPAQDRVNVMLFDDQVDKLYPQPRPLTAAVRSQAIEYVEMLQEGGGTDLALALKAALDAQHPDDKGGRPRVVLFFTDGQSRVDPVLEAAKRDQRDVRVFTVGFGPDVNRQLLARLAALKRGRFTPIPVATTIEREVAALYHQIEAPVLVDVSLEVDGAVFNRLYPRTLPDLFVDDELRIVGRLRGQGSATFTLRAKERGKEVTYKVGMDLPAEARRPWVGRLWAHARVDDLLQEIALGNNGGELKDEVTDLALAYNFVTPYTAFLAVPARELDAVSASELANARARKAELMRRKPDAARVASGGSGRGGLGTAGPEVAAATPADQGTDQLLSKVTGRASKKPPEPSSGFERPDGEMASGTSTHGDDENTLAQNEPPAPASGSPSPEEGEADSDGAPKQQVGLTAPPQPASSRRSPGGCASCDTAAGADPRGAIAGVAALAAAALLLGRLRAARARRRRSPQP